MWVTLPMAEIESVVLADCVADSIWRESVALGCNHAGIVSQTKLIWHHTDKQLPMINKAALA